MDISTQHPTPEELELFPLEPPEFGGVYAIYGWPGFVKIGLSHRRIDLRLESLQIGCPVDLLLLAVLSFRSSDEGIWHHRLWDHHHRGEWFRLEGSLISALKEARSNYFEPRKVPTFFPPGVSRTQVVAARLERRRYVLQRVMEGASYVDVGRELGLTSTRIRQVCVGAKRKMGRIQELWNPPLGGNIRSLRQSLGMSLEELGGEVCLRGYEVGRIETGKLVPDFRTIGRFAEALRTPPENLLPLNDLV